jgi:NTE family protein
MKRVLALTGGGVRGCMHIGALQALSEITQEQHLHKVFHKGIYGISIGAILGSMVGFGIPTHRILAHKQRFADAAQIFEYKDILTTFSRKGISTGESAHAVLRDVFRDEGLNFDDLTIQDARVPLHILAADIHTCKVVRFGGSVKLWDALRASFSLPVLFTPYSFGGSTFVDAAILMHTPMSIIPREDREDTLLLALTRKPSQTLSEDLGGFLFQVLSMGGIHEIEKYARRYPSCVCKIEESTISIAQVCTDAEVEYMIGKGKSAAHSFFHDLGT